ncbi:30S ribosomal protein S21 [Candidatus Parcubacteria bacterium]|nr:MAG: 30S ribosomal protein S21 [Candidatus Parcubacteria bacterium]
MKSKSIRDIPEVPVLNGNVERAIRELRGRVHAAGIFKILKLRASHPTTAARRRFKDREAVRRLKKWLV